MASKIFTCIICADHKSFNTRKSMEEHISLLHKKIICPKCKKEFSSLKYLKRHLKLHQENRKIFRCAHCDKEYLSKYKLKVHTDKVHFPHSNQNLDSTKRRRLFDCTHCQKSFFIKYHLIRHELTHTQSEGSYPCYFCPKKLVRQPSMEGHLRGCHTLEKPFTCPHRPCKYSSARAGDLKVHVQRHSPVENHKDKTTMSCYFCKKVFNHRPNLLVHLRNHTLEAPFPCTLCKRGFTTSSALSRHISTHTTEKPFRCPRCERSFVLKSCLKDHVLGTHDKIKRFFCEFCSYSAYLRWDVVRHTGNRHLSQQS